MTDEVTRCFTRERPIEKDGGLHIWGHGGQGDSMLQVLEVITKMVQGRTGRNTERRSVKSGVEILKETWKRPEEG